jgi:hypothetical protein
MLIEGRVIVNFAHCEMIYPPVQNSTQLEVDRECRALGIRGNADRRRRGNDARRSAPQVGAADCNSSCELPQWADALAYFETIR